MSLLSALLARLSSLLPTCTLCGRPAGTPVDPPLCRSCLTQLIGDPK